MRFRIIALILFAFISLTTCNYPYISEPTLIRIKTTTITLAWDPPVFNPVGMPFYVSGYKVYFRRHSDLHWTLLDEIEATSSPQYTIEHNKLGDGMFDFAVSSVSEKTLESTLHSSLESSAEPFTGWYIWWMNGE